MVLTAGDVDKVLSEIDLEAALQCQAKVFAAFSLGSDAALDSGILCDRDPDAA